MLNNKTLAIQLTVWLGLWLVFALGFGYEDKTAFDYSIDTWRVVAMASFYNIFYYLFLPFYFKGLRQKFFLWAPLAFLVFFSVMVSTDLMVHQYKFPQKEIKGRGEGAGDYGGGRRRPQPCFVGQPNAALSFRRQVPVKSDNSK